MFENRGLRNWGLGQQEEQLEPFTPYPASSFGRLSALHGGRVLPCKQPLEN